MSPSLLTKLRQHIADLLARHKIEHVPVTGSWPHRFRGEYADRRIFCPHVTTDLYYLVALHEIGHFATVSRRGTLLDEAAVWMWCREVALIWPVEFDQLVAGCLLTYAKKETSSARVRKITNP